MKLLDWLSIYSPHELFMLDPKLVMPNLLTPTDIRQIVGESYSIFWETTPGTLSMCDYAYMHSSGIKYENLHLFPRYVSFNHFALDPSRVNEIISSREHEVILDFIYLSIKI